jgi:hypothetical protein
MGNSESDAGTVMVREAVGVFHLWDDLQAAVDTLTERGFDRSELSLLAGEKTVNQKLRHIYQKTSELEDDSEAPRIAFVGRDSLTEGRAAAIGTLGYVGAMAAVGGIVASGGTLAAVILGAVAAGGAGSMIGTLLARALGRERASNVQKQLEKGGLLLWVRTRDAAHEQLAVDILTANKASDVHLHDLATRFDPDHDPLADLRPDPFLPQART